MRYHEITENYQGDHVAPSSHPDENTAPMYDLTRIYPEDVYGPSGSQYAYGQHESYAIAVSKKGRPNHMVKVYRAIPKDLKRVKINAGDWVTTSRAYAKEHGQDNLNNNYRIISASVPARHLWTTGDSFDEWGYDPSVPRPSDEQEDELRAKFGMRSMAEVKELRREQLRKTMERNPDLYKDIVLDEK